ncbi:MAG: hypothetical protein PHR45_09435 [Muribaculaceae bacterium]|nr:hypothetical protein [Muribaculaceae bacterium]
MKRGKCKYCIYILPVILLASLLFIPYFSCDKNEDREMNARNIVYISSFHDNHLWTENFRASLNKRFEKCNYQVNQRNIYLDAKNINSYDRRMSILDDKLTPTLKNIHGIIVSEYEAALQIKGYLEQHIIKDIPIVIASVFDAGYKIDQSNVYQLIQKVEIKETFLLARKMNPKAHKCYILSDKTASGQFFLNSARNQLKEFESKINIVYV